MADKYFRLRRKQDGFQTEPLTQKDAEGIAGFPADYEKVALPKGQSAILEGTVKPGIDTAEAPAPRKPAARKTAARRTATAKTATATPAAPTPPADAAGAATNEG